MKILITGAHFTPAVAVIEKLKLVLADIQIIYVGRKTTLEGDKTESVESKVLPELRVKFIPIITGRLQRSFSIYSILSPFKIPIGLIQSCYIILSEKPDVILSFGGYVSVPIVIVGWLFSIPIIIHEQTLVSGLANKISSLFAAKIAVSFNKNSTDQKVVVTGNPIRQEILNPQGILLPEYNSFFSYAKKQKKPVILILGGNQGSHTINVQVEKILDKLLNIAVVIHQTGSSSYQDFDRLKMLENDRYIVRKWIGSGIGLILSKADLLVSRAGANTLTEAALLRKPVLTIPFEPLYLDEQNQNAKFFAKSGQVRILSQSKLTDKSLLEEVKSMIKNLPKFKEHNGASAVIEQDGASRLVLETLLLARGS